MNQSSLQNKKQNLLAFFICFFTNHKKVDGEFTDDRGYVFSGKCSRCGALYGHPKFKSDGGIVAQVIVDSSLITKFE